MIYNIYYSNVMTVALIGQYLRLTNTKEASCRQTQIHTHTYKYD